jgi:hypothetical protein
MAAGGGGSAATIRSVRLWMLDNAYRTMALSDTSTVEVRLGRAGGRAWAWARARARARMWCAGNEMRAQDLTRAMCERIGVRGGAEWAKFFCVCECLDGVTLSRPLTGSDPVVPLLASWAAKGLRVARLVFRVQLVMKRIVAAAERDAVLAHLLFVDAVYDVVAGIAPVSAGDAVKLAALQVQAKFGDHEAARHREGFLVPQLRGLLPRRYLEAKSSAEWEEAILTQHKLLPDKRRRQPKLSYVELATAQALCGVSYYFASQSFHTAPPPGGGAAGAAAAAPPRHLLLGVHAGGIALYECGSKKRVDQLSLSELYRWGFKRGETFYWELKPAFSRPYSATIPASPGKGPLFQVATREGREASELLTAYAMQVLEDIKAARAAAAAAPGRDVLAATKLAALWRGHRTRAELRKRAAAVMVQALIRGYRARKDFERMLDALEHELEA